MASAAHPPPGDASPSSSPTNRRPPRAGAPDLMAVAATRQRGNSGGNGGAYPLAALRVAGADAKPSPLERNATRIGAALGAAAAAALATAASLARAPPAATALHTLYFTPLLTGCAMLWLWVGVVAHFERSGTRYDACFAAADRARLPPAASLARLALTATVIAGGAGTAFAAAAAARASAVARAAPVAAYASLLALALAPRAARAPAGRGRALFAVTAARVAVPVGAVSWSDFLLADVATSLAAPLAGAARALCHMVTAPSVLTPPAAGAAAAASSCGKAAPLIVAAACFPFAARFVQCVRVWRDTGAAAQLANAAKYATAFPAIVLAARCEVARGAVAEGVPRACWAWALAQTVNTLFSYYWDVERDWEVAWFSAPRQPGHYLPRPQLRHTPALPRRYYAWLLASNGVLRCAWLLRLLAPALAASPLAPLLLGVAEAARRAQWVPVRVEVELRKVAAARGEDAAPLLGGGGGGSRVATPRGAPPLVAAGGEP